MKKLQNNENDSFTIIKKDLNEIDRYWTEERMAKAIPHPSPKVSKKMLARLKKKINVTGIVESVEGSDVNQKNAGTKPQRANVKKRPYWNGGKIFFTKPNGEDYVGSAQFCGDAYIVLTAAHCIRDNKTGAWYKNVVFRRGYHDGGGQKITIKTLTTKAAWHNGTDNLPFEFDYSFLVAKTKSGAGWLGWKTLIPYSTWTAIGYPVAYDKGKYMQEVTGSKGNNNEPGLVEMLNNPMGPGCSGGAWIGELSTPHSTGNYAIGLNSFHFESQPNNEWSPLFDSSFSNLYRFALGFKSKKKNRTVE
ncbi:MAG: hypothetical protein U0U09_00690 [Cyclobacteriaceae bacterium]